MKYINYKTEHGLEKVDEAETIKETQYLVAEYNMAFGGGCCISSRCTNDWRDK
jgi:hypothetical protein|tara:strand:+ start:5651 stop:5809 length:159 start_codon:yes stop_codon:yes gene_type:complete